MFIIGCRWASDRSKGPIAEQSCSSELILLDWHHCVTIILSAYHKLMCFAVQALESTT